ncbi:MAG: secretin N-terminal domain-containing protein, partial [Burkholderiales bacterium]|nr:secretin N-terminal domain-containing protein [Burkholderiales bacterium]
APEPRFDLAVNNAPAAQVFLSIVSGSRYSMIVHPDIKDSISVNLKDVTVGEALETLRDLYGYEYRVTGNRIVVQPVTIQTRIYQINYLLANRQGRSDIRVTSGSISTPTGGPGSQGGPGTATGATGGVPGLPGSAGIIRPIESSRVTTTADNDFWGDLGTALRAIVGAEQTRNVVINPQSGLIVVRALPAELRQVENFLRRKQAIVERQVMLEAKIIEVTLRDSQQTGINWAAFRAGPNSRFGAGVVTPGTTLRTDGFVGGPTARAADGSSLAGSALSINPARANPLNPDPLSSLTGAAGSLTSAITSGVSSPGTLFGLAFQTSNFAALLSFLETQGAVDVLSSPRIATLSNQKAVLKVGTDEFFVTNVTTTTTSTGTTSQASPTITVQPFFSGIALDVTPQIDGENNIILHVHPSVSQVVDRTKSIDLGTLGNFRLPLASSTINETDSIVRVQDGNIVAIGGLMQTRSSNDRAQVPGLGNVPGFGHLFRNTARTQVKSELVILIKPTLIRSEQSWTQDLVETQERIQAMRRPVTTDSFTGMPR